MKYAINKIAEIEAHNARVSTLRSKSLSNDAVDAIDTLSEKALSMVDDILECLYNGVTPVFTTDELVEMKQAVNAVDKHFGFQTISEYLREQAEREMSDANEL